jgi:hypothetical protein
MKTITNFDQYKHVLPYDSEVFGVYQPLLGWKSKKIADRIRRGFLNDAKLLTRSIS